MWAIKISINKKIEISYKSTCIKTLVDFLSAFYGGLHTTEP